MATMTYPGFDSREDDVPGIVDETDRWLTDYTGAVRRHAFTVIASTLIGLMVGAVLVAFTPVVYHSSFSVLTPILPLYPAAGTGDRSARVDTIDTDSRELTATVEAVANGADVEIEVTAAPLTRVLTIRVTGSDAKQVAAISAASADKFVATFAADDREAAAKLSRDLSQQVIGLSADIAGLRRTAANLPAGDPRRGALQASVSRLSIELAEIKQTLSQVSTRQYTTAEIVKEASEARSDRPGKTVKLTSSMMLGLLIGLFLAWRTDRRPGS